MITKSLTFVLLGVMWFSPPASAFELTNSMTKDLEPIISVERDDTGVTVDYTFPGACQTEDDLYPGSFNLAIPGFGSNRNPGQAAWLMHWDSYEIPSGSQAQIEILAEESTFFNIAPTPLFENYGVPMQDCQQMQIVGVNEDNGILNVRYRILENDSKATVSVINLIDGDVKSKECNFQDNEVTFDMNGDSSGIYVIQLANGETVMDTQKVMLK